MTKVTLVEEEEDYETCMISGQETPIEILRHFGIHPEYNIVYINGRLVTSQKMTEPIKATGNIFLSVQRKTLKRG